ncbi:excalibur calcium-binding domain-containing protein [Sphingomonas sp.]|uniref:excalibur calcium-binding domain-containing protein n=1 Tax=Sphingomonas sp. TaxID=28214 RepID=UPI00286C9E03|nr:excalibur calcium-binding domain-containing protein [Sphingomonas sp.]
MRPFLIPVSAVLFGLAGGYVWSAMSAPAARVATRGNGKTIGVPPSPEERPAMLDKAWASRSDDSAVTAPAPESAVHYAGCNEVRAAGKAPLYAGDPGYSVTMDGDGDGIACEPYRAF